MRRTKGGLHRLIPIYLGRISLDDCHEYIVTNRSLYQAVNERTWPIIRQIASRSNGQISLEEVTQELKANRPDVLGVILNTPGGMDWLSRQIVEFKKQLTTSTTPQ